MELFFFSFFYVNYLIKFVNGNIMVNFSITYIILQVLYKNMLYNVMQLFAIQDND